MKNHPARQSHASRRGIAALLALTTTSIIMIGWVLGADSLDRVAWSLPYLIANASQMILLSLSLLKRPREIDESVSIFLISVISTVSPLFVAFSGALVPMGPRIAVLADLGKMLNLLTMPFYLFGIWTLGRRLTVLPEAHTLQTTGIYAMSRHPLYVTYLYWYAVQNLVFQSWLVLGLSVVQALLTVFRARREEQLLEKSFPEYAGYKQTVWWVGRRDLLSRPSVKRRPI